MDPETAERLLAGHGGGPPRLSELLARAAGPARPGELAGEDAAMAVFRSAQLAPRRRIVTAYWTRWATVKAAGLAFALAVGGVALAAGTGVLPHPLTIGATTPSQTPEASSLVASAGTGPQSTDPQSTVEASRSVSLHRLCRAFLAQVGHTTAKATDSPASAELIVAAGGAGNVTTYCESLVNGPSATTTQEPRKADNHPTGPPSPHPTDHDPKGKPSQTVR
jgi:hypothetical protein